MFRCSDERHCLIFEKHLQIICLLYVKCFILNSDGDPDLLWKQILIHISGGLDSILIFMKYFVSLLKISKNFVFFLRMLSAYLTRYGQGSVFKIRFQGSVFTTDPNPHTDLNNKNLFLGHYISITIILIIILNSYIIFCLKFTW